MIGCFGSITTASTKSTLCATCSHKELCHEEAKKTLIYIFGEFTGFPMDSDGKRKKKGKKDASVIG
uniref:Uncharacterized protein n=1 Tax=Pectobacterium carotovorum TaxID=554 RepID=A0A0K0MPZ5_PECCA|nr:hypothetical protein [Pectobacterium carotovorum]AKG47514.1 hypothetical protein pA_00074 [Pectobacterium carotovorum]